MKQSRPPLVRMQYIDQQLRNTAYPNCSRIASHFEVSSKSIQRDIGYMRDMLHAPIDYDRKRRGFFYTGAWTFLPSATIDRQEAAALAATKKVLSQYQGTPYYEEVSRAIDKVLQYLPGTLPGDDLLEVYSFEQPLSADIDPVHFARIEDAIRNRLMITMHYHASSRQEETVRTVRPYRLHYDQSKGTWYLIAHCELRGEMRTFAVSRIRCLSLKTDHFDFPDSFSIGAYLGKTFDQISGTEDHVVAIRFTPYQSQWIRERRWHPTQEIEEHEDGSLTLTLHVGALEAVKRWIMRYGQEAEVLEPQELRDMIRDEVLCMGEMYMFGKK